jgi:hypothetical protein
MEYSESFWAVKCGCTVHRVTEREADNVRSAIANTEPTPAMHPDLYQISDIYGGMLYIDLKSVTGIWESTPELRIREGEHQQQLEKEYNGDKF